MKKIIIALAVAAMAAPMACEAQQPQYGGPGIAVAGSTDAASLPDAAKKFLDKHYKHVATSKVEKEYVDGSYEVDLANGVEIDFNSAGRITSIEAPDNGAALDENVVKDILPHKAFQELKKVGQNKNVEEIDFKDGKLYEVETRSIKGSKYGYFLQEEVWKAL